MHVQCHERKRVILESLFIAIRRLQGVRRGRAGSLDDPRFKVVAGGPGLLFRSYNIHISIGATVSALQPSPTNISKNPQPDS
jgi:hypothetical protein